MKQISENGTNRERGFTLLLAALVATIVLAIGSAVFSIALKQVALSSIGKDSQLAFYAADSAAECALYWDIRTDVSGTTGFATSTDDVAGGNPLTTVNCAGQEDILVTIDTINSSPEQGKSFFWYAPQGYCAQVTVTKFHKPGAPGISTTVHADGYSTAVDPASKGSGCRTAIANDPNALQRSVELHY